jgi:uncharacterized protein
MIHEAVPLKAHAPVSGVELTGGPFRTAFENNIGYLKNLSIDAILYWFRLKAGLPAPGQPYRGHFEDNIKGQTAGMFLMGAANSLRWKEDPELRAEVESVIDGIDTATEPDGFYEPIPKSEFGTLEYPNYVRVWMNYGLKAASLIGNPKALPLMRGMQDWFNACDERPIVKHLGLAFQGVIANTTVAFSKVGKPEDIQAVVDWYEEDWWLGQFLRKDLGAIHKRPTPHGTELEAITAYLDMYRATGKVYYLNAVKSAYAMFRDYWQHVGGGIVAIEMTEITPGCDWLDPIHKYNELCCSAHWLYLNQRLHQLYPDQEAYVAEIEKTLYNIVIANQVGEEFIRYHAYIDIQKDCDFSTPVSCCAGLGTRILGSLPEFLYSIDPQGISVDIYSDSRITWQHARETCQLSTRTSQPTGSEVQITIDAAPKAAMALRLRVPGWVRGEVTVSLNGSNLGRGIPGSYLVLEREWLSGDKICFKLPLWLKPTRYKGLDAVSGCERYAYEWGALLLGVTGALNARGRYLQIHQDPEKPGEWAVPMDGKPGHFYIKDKPGCCLVPYSEIGDEVFTCYPIFQKPA